MRDDVIFETRLADALARYAELAPVMDDEVIAREAIAAGGSPRRFGWLASLRRGGLGQPTAGRSGMRTAYILVVLALVLAVIFVALAVGAFRNDSFQLVGRNGAIVFTVQGNDHGPPVIHAMNPDGTGDHAIEADRCPTYSKDGRVLAALSIEGSAYLVVRDADGNPAYKVLLVDAPVTSPSYDLSPDGTQVSWFKPIPDTATGGDIRELWVAPVVGGPGGRILPRASVPNEFYASPVWSPDGGRVAFGSYVADAITGERHRSAIHVVAADGSDLRRLTTRPGLLEDTLSWSPDGRFLAYLGLPDGAPNPTSATGDAPTVSQPRDVFVIGADGTGDRNLTNTPAFESQPAWSPDGAALAFDTSADGEAHRLTTIQMDGPTPVGRPLLGPESDWFVWSPDGTQLLWLEATSLGAETYRSTLHAIDPDFRRSSTTLQTVDGLIVCPPSWQRLEP